MRLWDIHICFSKSNLNSQQRLLLLACFTEL
uniref:Uncharacterized protein n=1 Tax=Rhizophora mucronata TaxID=61149 RepID=A0A2P2KE41_RHIMU